MLGLHCGSQLPKGEGLQNGMGVIYDRIDEPMKTLVTSAVVNVVILKLAEKCRKANRNGSLDTAKGKRKTLEATAST